MALPKFLPLLWWAGALALTPSLRAQATPEADAAWAHLQAASPLPKLPPEWQKTPPADHALIRDTLRAETERLLALAEQARAFATKYPADSRRLAAWQEASVALTSALKLGSPAAREQLAALDRERLADAQLPAPQRLEIRMRQVAAEAEALAATDPVSARDKFEEGSRALVAEFPQEPEPWAMLMEVIDQGNDPASRAKLQQVADSEAPALIKDRARAILHRYDLLGKPLDLRFTALDGREVDLAKLRGKVVLIHFWATWCDTCVTAIETLSKAYQTLGELGVELIGIDADSDKAAVEQFVKDQNVAWPQFYEPAGQANRLVREWGITNLPAMWMIDRNGLLRDLNAQVDLTKKLEKMVAEPTGQNP